MIRKILLGVILMTVSMSLAGCIGNQQEYEEQACRLLEEKYQESFEIVKYYGREWMEDYYSILAVSQKHPDLLFEAKAACDGSYIVDEYVTARVCRQIEERITENLGGLQGYTVVKVEAVSKTIDSVDANMSLEKYMSIKTMNEFLVYLHYCPEDGNRNVFPALTNMFQGMNCLSGYIEVYMVDERVLRQVQEYLGENARIYYGYEKLLEDIEKRRYSINDGKIG